MNQQQNQLNLNLHRQRLIAMAIALVALISMLLPWSSLKAGVQGIEGQNGFASWGFLSLIGILGVIGVSFAGNKTQPYQGLFKQLVMGAFALIAIGAIIFMIRVFTGSQEFETWNGRQSFKLSQLVSPGFGIYLCIIAALAGLAFVSGVIKVPVVSTGSPGSGGSMPPPPPPPPPTA